LISETSPPNSFSPTPCPPPRENPAWALDPSDLKHLSIRWPSKYEWDEASDWVEMLRFGFRQHLRVETVDDIPQLYKGTVVFEAVCAGSIRRIAIGYSDYLAIDEDCAENCDLYFKMQFDKLGYGRKNVIPGGYVPDGKRLYFHLKGLRKLRDRREFRFDVNARFSLNYAPEIRKKAISLLSEQQHFGFEGGVKTLPYIDFLREAARSRICIDLPGLGPLCFRLMNYLAIGTFVIAYPHKSLLHVPLVDREHIVYCKEDFSDLLDLCEYYLANGAERERIASNAFFDLNLHKDNLVRYYLNRILKATN